MKTIFFLSYLEFFDGVERDVGEVVKVTEGLEISLNSNAVNLVPLYVNTNDSFLISSQSSLVKFLPRALLITKRTSTEPQITSWTMTSDFEISSRWVSVVIKLDLKSSLSAMALQLAWNFTKNVSLTTGEAALGFEEDDSNVWRMVEGATFVSE